MSRRQATKMNTVPSQTLESPDPQSIHEGTVLCLKAATSSSFAAEQEQDVVTMENLAGGKEQDNKVVKDKPALEMAKEIESKASLREASVEDQTMKVYGKCQGFYQSSFDLECSAEV